jgi:hypothetical protein
VFERVDAPGLIKTGWWVQVNASVKSNGSSESPGIYLNQQMVLFVKQDKEISSGPDAATAFAGAAVASLPGVAAMPFAGAAPQAGMPHPGMAAMPGTPAAAMPMQPAMAAAAADHGAAPPRLSGWARCHVRRPGPAWRPRCRAGHADGPWPAA